MYHKITILPPYPLPYPPADTTAAKAMVATTARIIFMLLKFKETNEINSFIDN